VITSPVLAVTFLPPEVSLKLGHEVGKPPAFPLPNAEPSTLLAIWVFGNPSCSFCITPHFQACPQRGHFTGPHARKIRIYMILPVQRLALEVPFERKVCILAKLLLSTDSDSIQREEW
jgi:hypothetical protein